MYSFTIVDWRATLRKQQDNEISASTPQKDLPRQFYLELVKSTEVLPTGERRDDLSIDTFVAPIDVTECLEKVTTLYELIKTKNQKIFERYVLLGITLRNLKYHFYVFTCSVHAPPHDTISLVNCTSCGHLKSNGEFLRHFYSGVSQRTDFQYSKSYINFLIQVGKLASDYPKFKKITASIYDLKKYIKQVTRFMEIEKDFWSDCGGVEGGILV